MYFKHCINKWAHEIKDLAPDNILKDCEDQHKKTVHNFHCMAHMLLGFHKYACDDLKILESNIVQEHGPLGRDTLSIFKFWGNKGTVLERVVRTTSDTFGPAGDHLGLRDRWEAYCSNHEIKSVIGNYRDNRFNAVFQTAAEVSLHMEDFLKVIETVRQPNKKIKAVQADLKSPIIHAILQCFGLVYVKVTGPYWNLVTCGSVTYVELHPYIQELADFLQKCSDDPALKINREDHWSCVDTLEITVPGQQRYEDMLCQIKETSRDLLFTAIRTVTKAMLRTVEKQLTDFLPGGLDVSTTLAILTAVRSDDLMLQCIIILPSSCSRETASPLWSG